MEAPSLTESASRAQASLEKSSGGMASSSSTSSSSHSSLIAPQQQRALPTGRRRRMAQQVLQRDLSAAAGATNGEQPSLTFSSSGIHPPGHPINSSLSQSTSSTSRPRTSTSSTSGTLSPATPISEEQWQQWLVLQQQGQEFQAAGNIDAALACYLRLVRDQWQRLEECGDSEADPRHSLQVARQLVQVGNLLEEKQKQDQRTVLNTSSTLQSNDDSSDDQEDDRARQEQMIVNVHQQAASIYAQRVLQQPWLLFPEDSPPKDFPKLDPSLLPWEIGQMDAISVAQVVLQQLVPVLMQHERFDDSIVLLHKALESLSALQDDKGVPLQQVGDSNKATTVAGANLSKKERSGCEAPETAAPSTSRVRAQLQLALGKAYMGVRKYTAATVCLVEAAAQYETNHHDSGNTATTGDDDDDEQEADEEEIFGLLGQMEFLQRQQSNSAAEEDEDSSWRKWTDSSSSSSDSRSRSRKGSSGGAFPMIENGVKKSDPASVVDSVGLGGGFAPSRSITRMIAEAEEPETTTSTLEQGYQADAPVDSSTSLRRQVMSDDEGNESSTCFGSDLLTSDVETTTTATSLLDPPVSHPAPLRHSSLLPVESMHDEIEVDLLRFEEDTQGARLMRADPTEDSGILSSTTSATSNPLGGLPSSPLLGENSSRMTSDSSRTSLSGSDFECGSRQRRGLRIPGSPRRNRKSAGRKKFRGLNRRDGFASLPEEVEDEDGLFRSLDKDDEDKGSSRRRALSPELLLDEEYHTSSDGPVPYITGPTLSDDVSEITFVVHAVNSSRESSGEWWWGVTAEGFGRWFPTHIVSPAFEAAEGFLSAKAIHSQAKNKNKTAPLDFDSDDESTTDNEQEVEAKAENDEDTSSTETDEDQATHLGVASQKKSVTNLFMSSSREFEYKVQSQSGARRHSGGVFSRQISQSSRLAHRDIDGEIADLENIIATKRQDATNGGEQDADLADSLFTLAVLQSRKGSLDDAIISAQDAFRIQKSSGNMSDATRSLHFLADLHLHQKQYDESLMFYSETARMEKKECGYYSEEVAKTLNCIGTVRSLQKEFRLAMDSHKEALQILKEVHGEDLKHPLVSETLCQIGSVYYRERNSLSTIQAKKDDYSTFIETGMLEVIGRAHEDRGSYKLAIAFFEEKLQFLKNNGKEADSPEDIAATLNSLGMLSARAGLFVEAAEYYEGALSIQKDIGCDRLQLATAQVLIASVQFQLGDWKNSLKQLREALEILHGELGEDHETVAATLYQIGLVHSSMCAYDEAMTALEDALSIQTLLLGEEHPATLRTRRQIGTLYAVYEAELETAFEEFQEILALQKEVHGERHPNVAETLHSIGCAYARKGDMTSALRTLEECYYMRVEFLGWDHPLQAATLHEIASIHLKSRRIKRALHICDNVISIYKESLGEQHIDLARILTTKGACYIARGDFAAATKCFDEALPMAEEIAGKSHPVVADIYVQRGTIYLRKCQFDEARSSIQKALEMYRNAQFDEDHPSIRDAVKTMERVDHDEMLCV